MVAKTTTQWASKIHGPNPWRARGPVRHVRPVLPLVCLMPGLALHLMLAMQCLDELGEIHPPTTPAHTTHAGKNTPHKTHTTMPHAYASQAMMHQPAGPPQG